MGSWRVGGVFSLGAGGERPDSHPLLVAWPSAPRAGGQALSSDPRYALSDIYDAEHQFLAAQHNLLETAVDKRLRNPIEDHVRETEGQIRNLEQVFQLMADAPKRQPIGST
jgi:hypothetical protein